jgi:hypothetical protein
VSHTRFEGFYIGDVTSTTNALSATLASFVIINRVGINNMTTTGVSGTTYGIGAGGNAIVKNCVVNALTSSISTGSKSIVCYGIGLGSSSSAFNCVVSNLSCVSSSTTSGANASCYGISGGNTTTAKNCVIFNTSASAVSPNAATHENFGTSVIQSYNASEDATAAGTGSITGITGSNELVNASTINAYLLPTSQLRNAGTDLSATFTDDVAGRTRRSGVAWDIGAAEFYPNFKWRIAPHVSIMPGTKFQG